MDFTSPDTQSKQRVVGAKFNEENLASVVFGIASVAGFDCGNTSYTENLPVFSDIKVSYFSFSTLIHGLQ